MEFDEEYTSRIENQFKRSLMCVATGTRKNYYKKRALEAARVSLVCDFTDEAYAALGATEDELFINDISFENETLSLALTTLTEKQREVLFKLFIDQMAEKEVAAILKKTQQYVNATKRKSLHKIKKYFEGGNGS